MLTSPCFLLGYLVEHLCFGEIVELIVGDIFFEGTAEPTQIRNFAKVISLSDAKVLVRTVHPDHYFAVSYAYYGIEVLSLGAH